MTALEKHALQHAIKERANPSAPGHTWHRGKIVHDEQLVPGTANDKLLDSPEYLAGYRHAHKQIAEIIAFILTAKPRDLRRFAGKPKGGA